MEALILSVNEVERKAKDALKNNKIKPKSTIKTSDLSEHILKKILKDLPVKFIKKGKADLAVVEKTMDNVIVDFLAYFFYNKPFPKQKANEIYLFERITDAELIYYAKKNNLKFQPSKKDKKLETFIENLYKKYPDTKYGLLSSFKKLQKSIK